MSEEEFNSGAQHEQFLVFLLDGKNYGFPILEIESILSIPKIFHLPNTPDHVKGIINVRGQIIPIIDLRLIFNMEEKEYNQETCIVLIKTPIGDSKKLIGIVVDTVSEVFDIPFSDIDTSTGSVNAVDEEYLRGIAKVKEKIILLLNIDKIINTKENVDFLNTDEAKNLVNS